MTEKTARQIENMKAQTFGVEVEGNNITRQKAAKVSKQRNSRTYPQDLSGRVPCGTR